MANQANLLEGDKMKLSEHKAYIEYGRYIAIYDYNSARQSLTKILQDLETEFQFLQGLDAEDNLGLQSFILQSIGDTFFYQGDTKQAIVNYELSISRFPTCLLTQYNFAKFLADKMKDKAAAINKCNEIIIAATKHPFAPSDYDLGSDEYIKMANDLKINCK